MGGAITILDEYYNEALVSKEEFVFVVSKVKLKATKNIKIINVPWIKKSWILRMFFYFFKLPKLIKKEKPDHIISLNNTKTPIKNFPQTIYLHQALPFSKYKIKFILEPYLWAVKHLIGFLIKYSIKRVDSIIVQSLWLKEILVNQIGISEDKIQVKSPRIHFDSKIKYVPVINNNKTLFFYPSGYASYKNHSMIVEAVNKLTEKDKDKIEIKFTLNPFENKYVSKLYDLVVKNNLPIQFIGYQNKKMIQEMYSDHILIFASSIETFGLPLLEAQIAGTPIIALKAIYTKDIISDYSGIDYFENAQELIQFLLSH
jgi:glycosyltransferase involved in cell wall biosynthesis